MKTGRPRVSNDLRKDKVVGIRLKNTEHALIAQAAARRGMTVANWTREALMKAASEKVNEKSC
jgi:uncharacterized protein (DUF1778 family)